MPVTIRARETRALTMDSMSSCNPTVGGAAATSQLSPVRADNANRTLSRVGRGYGRRPAEGRDGAPGCHGPQAGQVDRPRERNCTGPAELDAVHAQDRPHRASMRTGSPFFGGPRRGVESAGMKLNRSIPAATVIPVLIYPDVREAVAWLSAAFGFVERVRIGENHRAQLRFGAVIVGDVRDDRRPPRPGEVTHSVMVRVDDARAHCERARAHGARILMEPTDFDYGERQFTAQAPAGHRWTFSETLADIAPEEWGGESVRPD